MFGGLVAGALALALAGPTPAPDLRHVHSSGRYDRSTVALADQAARFVGRAGVVTWTEVAGRARAVRQAMPGYRTFRPPESDTAITWRRARWRPVARWGTDLAPGTAGASWALLRDRRHPVRVLVTVAHLPAHVEYGDTWRANGRVGTWRQAVATWHAQLTDARRRYRPALVLVCADWNIDVRRAAWRAVLAATFPRLRLTWTEPYPAAGTHRGGRLIDASLTTAPGRARLMPDDESSDHRPYRERLALYGPRPAA